MAAHKRKKPSSGLGAAELPAPIGNREGGWGAHQGEAQPARWVTEEGNVENPAPGSPLPEDKPEE